MTVNIGTKRGFSCINIRHVPWEVLKTEAEGHVRSLLLHNSRYFLHYFVSLFHRCLTNVVLGPGSTHLVTAANLWPRYDRIESCVAVH